MTAVELDNLIQQLNLDFVIRHDKISERVFEFDLSGRTRIWTVQVSFDESFPFSLPSISTTNDDVIGSAAHINQSGVLCIEERDTLLIDYANPKGILHEVITQSLRHLGPVDKVDSQIS